jgi:hypothetical protein
MSSKRNLLLHECHDKTLPSVREFYILMFNIVMYTRFGLENGFPDHLYTPLGTTYTWSSTYDLCDLRPQKHLLPQPKNMTLIRTVQYRYVKDNITVFEMKNKT